jgi:hypothetical protein
MYHSPYAADCPGALQYRRSGSGPAWCIFDDTAEGWATHDALLFQHALEPAQQSA